MPPSLLAGQTAGPLLGLPDGVFPSCVPRGQDSNGKIPLLGKSFFFFAILTWGLGCLLACMLAWLLACLPCCVVGWLGGCLVAWLLACLLACLPACLLAWCGVVEWLLGCLLPCLPHLGQDSKTKKNIISAGLI